MTEPIRLSYDMPFLIFFNCLPKHATIAYAYINLLILIFFYCLLFLLALSERDINKGSSVSQNCVTPKDKKENLVE